MKKWIFLLLITLTFNSYAKERGILWWKYQEYLDVSKIMKASYCLIWLAGDTIPETEYNKHLNQQLRYNTIRRDMVNLLATGELQPGDWVYILGQAHEKTINYNKLHGSMQYQKKVKAVCKNIKY